MTATEPLPRRGRSRVARARRPGLFWLVALVLASTTLRAQCRSTRSLIGVTSDAADRLRLAQLMGGSSSADFLIRSASRLSFSADTLRATCAVLLPEVRSVHNSQIPYSLNDGPLWAGRGWNTSVTAGVALQAGPVRLIAAPTFVSEQNLDFQVIPYRQDISPPRSVWANPFHPPPESIDLPLRFGDRPIERIDPGQSSLTVTLHNTSIGAATENLWWGPAIRNAITLSNNAPGFPHLFVGTDRPAHTRIGSFDAQWVLGRLAESAYFDSASSDNWRSLSGAVIAWTPPGDTVITIGVARLALATMNGPWLHVGSAFDVLRSAGHADVDTGRALPNPGRDQITSFFGRWLFPTAGFEAYVEWARFEEPRSLRDFLESPGHSEGYTIGVQWAHPLDSTRAVQLQSEASYLEPDPSLRVRPVSTTYTSRGVPQGFTQEGQALGAAIGPGASSQWLAGDVFARRWRAGMYLGRIRWDNATLFEPIVPFFKRQDVSLFAGVRGGVSWRSLNLDLDFTHAARFDYLFQAYLFTAKPPRTGGVDLINNTLALTLSSALPHR